MIFNKNDLQEIETSFHKLIREENEFNQFFEMLLVNGDYKLPTISTFL